MADAGGRSRRNPRLPTALLLLGVLGAGAGLAVAVTSRPVYSATTSSFVGARSERADLGERPPSAQPVRHAYAALATSPVVLDRVIDTLGLPTTADRLAEELTVDEVDQAVLRITARDPSATRAVTIANAVQSELVRQSAQLRSARLAAVETAQVPDRPSSPNLALDVAVGALVGVAAWLLLLLLRSLAHPRTAEGQGIAPPSMF